MLPDGIGGSGGGNDTAQIIIAAATLITALGALITGVVNTLRIVSVSGNVQKIELATNSMKDALVEATAKAALAEGTAVGLKQGRIEGNNPPIAESSPEVQKVEITNTPETPVPTVPGKRKRKT